MLRLGFRNAHWITEELARSNQPWPHQLAGWRRRGVKTVVSLRGGTDGSHHLIERAACRALGLQFVTFRIGGGEPPSRATVEAAAELFQTIAYPALIHCKSGSDRTGVMGALYLHLRRGRPIGEALTQLSWRYGHLARGKAGVLDLTFRRYRETGEPAGLDFLEWVSSPLYDPAGLLAEYGAGRAARGLERLAGRELGTARDAD